MARITQKGTPSYNVQEKGVPDGLFRWLQYLQLVVPYVATYSESLNPTQVNANDESTQTFTVTGLTTQDVVIVNPPALAAGLGIMYARVSAANTLQIRFRNFTGSNIDPASGTYNIVAIRL